MNYKLHKIIFVTTFSIFLFVLQFVFVFKVQAAEFSFDIGRGDISIGDQFKVDFVLNTEGESINAFEGQIIFPKELLEVSEIRDGNSIVNFWVKRPSIDAGVVAFSGIVPGGYVGVNGELFTLIFKAKTEGQGIIDITLAKALKNDGNGTATKLKIDKLSFNILNIAKTDATVTPKIKDGEVPESFKPEVSSDPSIDNGKFFVVFSTTDKGVGIDRYEVKETKNRIFTIFSSWNNTDSPYILKDQNLHSFIYVKAIDKVGNARIVKVFPNNILKWYQSYENWFILVILVGSVFFWLWGKNKKNLFHKTFRK